MNGDEHSKNRSISLPMYSVSEKTNASSITLADLLRKSRIRCVPQIIIMNVDPSSASPDILSMLSEHPLIINTTGSNNTSLLQLKLNVHFDSNMVPNYPALLGDMASLRLNDVTSWKSHT